MNNDTQQEIAPKKEKIDRMVEVQNTWKRVWDNIWPGVDFNSPTGVSNDFVNVNCPFHLDNKASSGVNINTGYFNCFSDTCDASDGFTFKQLLKHYYKLENDRVTDKMFDNLSAEHTKDNTKDKIEGNHNHLLQDSIAYNDVVNLGISAKVISEMRLGNGTHGETFSLPITMDSTLLGFKFYNKNPKEGYAKAWSSKGLFNGLIAPYNQWKASNDRITLICAGEKDMLVARSYGFNAITIIGGEGQFPTIGTSILKSKEVWIAYDNDIAGVSAGKKLANYLFNKKKITNVKNITLFHAGMKEKEDITDYFTKYYHTGEEFKELGNLTPYWNAKDTNQFLLQDTSTVSLTQAANNKLYGKTLNSFVQVKATAYEPKSIPSYFKFTGLVKEGKDIYPYEFDLEITSDNMKHVLGLTQPNTQTQLYIKNVLFKVALNKSGSVPWEFMSVIKYGSHTFDYSKNLTIFSSYVGVYKEDEIISTKTDDSGLSDDIASFSVYTLNQPLQTSQIYRIEYKPTRNEFDNNTIVLMCSEFEDSENSIHSFEIGEKTVSLLRTFNRVNTVGEKIGELFNKFKDKRIKHLNFDLWLTNELTFHTPLMFRYKGRKTRGTLYTTIIGDTRVGKSEVSQELVSLYAQGKFVNAKLTTTDAIIGGTVTRGKEQMIQAGILPKANKSLVILEEIHGLGNDYFKKITEVKSSSKVIINRVSGELKLDCMVRLIEIANPKTRDGESRSIAEFSNGVEIIKNLILAPEDIARNDIYMVVSRAPLIESTAVEFTDDEKESYRERIKWVWSRSIDDIIFEDESYVWAQAQELNKVFDCEGLTLLGAEAHIKLARISVALAGILASTNNIEYKTIYVTKDHVSYAKAWLQHLYSNDIMRVDEYVKESREYEIVTDDDLRELRRLFAQFEPQLKALESSTEVHQDSISQSLDVSNRADFFNPIQTYKFVRLGTGMKAKYFNPSKKFRDAMKIIRAEQKELKNVRIGEQF